MSTKLFCINKNNVIVAPGPLVHGLTLYPVIESLINGTTAVINKKFNSKFLDVTFKRFDNIYIVMVPTMLFKFVEDINPGITYANVKKIIAAGTKLNDSFILVSKKIFPSAKIIEYYGASELGFIGYRELTKVDDLNNGFALMDSVKVQITDDNINVVTTNTVGTIWVKSEYLSLGYALKECTEVKQDTKLWATVEDKGYLDKNNLLHLIGRTQNMVISGGKNIYPIEVENIIKSNPSIKNACVLGVTDSYWGTTVCAVIQWNGNNKLSKIDLHDYCNNFIERYKLPKRIFEVQDFPLTSSGKIKLNVIIENILNNSYIEIQ